MPDIVHQHYVCVHVFMYIYIYVESLIFANIQGTTEQLLASAITTNYLATYHGDVWDALRLYATS